MVGLLILASPGFVLAQWKPVPGPLSTKWSEKVTPETAHREYPRPQLVRRQWTNLNGLWDYGIARAGQAAPADMDSKILVPFPIESSLSGVMKRVGKDEILFYRREFEIPRIQKGERLLLHFGAVDWHTRVFVNEKPVGQHVGGYDPFTYDITAAVDRDRLRQTLLVAVSDPTDAGYQPRGKQIARPHGIWYTPVTGIWQTVWLEVVPATYIADVYAVPDIDNSRVSVQVTLGGDQAGGMVEAIALDGETVVARTAAAVGKPIELSIKSPKLWSPENPHLYDLKVSYRRPGTPADGRPDDEASSYFAMRKISLGKDDRGLVRILLNNEFVFQSGTLDQGYWPDGLYAAPSDEALRYDLEVTKKLGFNMVRKHVKVEPARWYRHCDELGLLVWQDMPSGDRYIGPNDPDPQRTAESAKNFRQEWSEIVRDLRAFPCIVMWVPFNEGWGQFETAEVAAFTKELDPTRLVNSASGWTDRGVGDVHDIHVYPGPGAPKPEEKRAIVLGEFGGLGLPLENHTWQAKDNWGYRSYSNVEDLNYAFLTLFDRLPDLIAGGLSAAVYTQTTDVEIEVNGLLTYDRKVLKIKPEVAQRAHEGLKKQIERIDTVVPTSEKEGIVWRYTTKRPEKEWTSPDFDDSGWSEGKGGFGEPSTPGSVVRTEWKTNDIWLRRTVEVEKRTWHRPALRAHWDEDTEVHFNGKLAARTSGYTTDYVRVPLTTEGEAELAKGGKLVIAVHTHQTGGGQYIDLGIVDVVEKPAE
jgi:hypothetical protein